LWRDIIGWGRKRDIHISSSHRNLGLNTSETPWLVQTIAPNTSVVFQYSIHDFLLKTMDDIKFTITDTFYNDNFPSKTVIYVSTLADSIRIYTCLSI
jgi:hypothetical protein